MPPREYRSISKDELRRKWFDEQWEQRMTGYHLDEWHFTATTLRIWKNGNDIMAAVKEYHYPGGTPNTVVRQLRDGDVLYYIP